MLHTPQCSKDLWSPRDSGGSFPLDLNSLVSGKPDCFSSSKDIWVLRAGLAWAIHSVIYHPQLLLWGTKLSQGVLPCALRVEGIHLSMASVILLMEGFFLQVVLLSRSLHTLKRGEWEGLCIWDSQGKQNIPSPSSWHLPEARLSLVPRSRIWSLSSVLLWEDMQSGRCGRRVCLLKWQLGLTWKENSKLPDCFPCLCSSCLMCRHCCNVKCVQTACIHPFPPLLLVVSFPFVFHVSPSDLKPSDINRNSGVEASRAWWGWRCLLMDRKGSVLPDGCCYSCKSWGWLSDERKG